MSETRTKSYYEVLTAYRLKVLEKVMTGKKEGKSKAYYERRLKELELGTWKNKKGHLKWSLEIMDRWSDCGAYLCAMPYYELSSYIHKLSGAETDLQGSMHRLAKFIQSEEDYRAMIGKYKKLRGKLEETKSGTLIRADTFNRMYLEALKGAGIKGLNQGVYKLFINALAELTAAHKNTNVFWPRATIASIPDIRGCVVDPVRTKEEDDLNKRKAIVGEASDVASWQLMPFITCVGPAVLSKLSNMVRREIGWEVSGKTARELGAGLLQLQTAISASAQLSYTELNGSPCMKIRKYLIQNEEIRKWV